MVGFTGHRILSRVRSDKKLRMNAAEDVEQQKLGHRRQQSDPASAAGSSFIRAKTRNHWPPIEWDPLKLNPPVTDLPALPASAERSLPHKTSFAGHGRRRPRFHHSDSGLDFDFAAEREKVMGYAIEKKNPRRDAETNAKAWPSPASSVDSNKSWFDSDDTDGDEDGAVKRSNELWDDSPVPRRRPQTGSMNDPGYFLKRGAWKRRGIVFGGPTESGEVYQKEDDAFDLI